MAGAQIHRFKEPPLTGRHGKLTQAISVVFHDLIFLSFLLHLLLDRVLAIKPKILQQLPITTEENTMASVTIDNKQFIKDYVNAMTAHPKTEDLINQYVSDPA